MCGRQWWRRTRRCGCRRPQTHTHTDESHAHLGDIKALVAVERDVDAEASGGSDNLLDPRLVVRATLVRVLGSGVGAAGVGQRVGAKAECTKMC